MANNTDFKKRLDAIEKRNVRVESEKAWETSWTRKAIVATLTYATIVLFFIAAGLPKPFINSLVPAAAFILSTLSLPLFRKIWERYKK